MKVSLSSLYFDLLEVMGRTWAKTYFWKNFKFIFWHQLLRHWIALIVIKSKILVISMRKPRIDKQKYCEIYVCVCVSVCVRACMRACVCILRDLIFAVGNIDLRTCRDFFPTKQNYDNYSFKEDDIILEVRHAFYSKCQSFDSNKVYRLSLMELNSYYKNFKLNRRALWVIGTFSHVF